MTWSTSRLPYSSSDEPFDLSSIFIEREQQLDLFQTYLDRWKNLMYSAAPVNFLLAPPSPDNKLPGLIVMLHGRGGFGKSTLLRRYRDSALAGNQNPLVGRITVSKVVDWEFAIEDNRSLFSLALDQEIDAFEYYRLLWRQLAQALDKKVQDFKQYRAAEKAVEEATNKAIGVLNSLKSDDRYDWLRTLSVEAVIAAVRLQFPVSSIILGNEKVKDALTQAVKVTQEQVSQMRAQLRDKLADKIDDFLDPALRLGLALGKDLREFARNYPLLIFFDTYEEIDEGDKLLRIVMGAAGQRVGWVLAGRDNLWAGSEQRKRSIGLEYGYKNIVQLHCGLSVNFNSGDIGAFTLSGVMEYFQQLCEKVQPPLPKVTEEEAKRILDITQGVPLAVKISAGLYRDTEKLNTITEEVKGKREIVEAMVERYLLHARDNQEERAKLYGLAMLRRADRPAAVATALGLEPEQAPKSYISELTQLQRRYSFVFTEKEDASLHQEVRSFMRLWLLQRYNQPGIEAINKQLKETHEDSLKKLENQRKYPGLKERLRDDKWVGVYLDLTEQQFWLEPTEGLQYLLPFMIAAAIYREEILGDAVEVGEFFKGKFRSPYNDWWRWMIQSVAYGLFLFSGRWMETAVEEYNFFPSLGEEPHALEELEKMAHQGKISFPKLLPGYRRELEALLWWRLGTACNYSDDTRALEWFEKSLTRLGQDEKLINATAQIYSRLSYKLHQEKKYADAIPLLNKAIKLMPDNATYYIDQGVEYIWNKEYGRAIEDFDQAIKLVPSEARTYIERGIAYSWLKEYGRAIEDFDQAIKMAPSEARAYIERGYVYSRLKEYRRAIEDYDQAIKLDPSDAKAYYERGRTYADFKEYERAMEDCNLAIELNPSDAKAFLERGYTYVYLKKFKQAHQDFDRAIELDPSNARAFSDRGYTYVFFKEFKQAHQDFDRAIELDPTYDLAYPGRGLTNLHLGEREPAHQDFDRGIRLNPKSVRVAWLDIWTLMGKQRIALETAEDLEKIAANDPETYSGYVCRGVALGLRSRLKEGLEVLEQANSQVTIWSWDYWFWKGMLCAYYYPSSKYHAAKETIDKALDEGMPTILLMPLFWLEKDRPEFFEQYIKQLLKKYEI